MRSGSSSAPAQCNQKTAVGSLDGFDGHICPEMMGSNTAVGAPF